MSEEQLNQFIQYSIDTLTLTQANDPETYYASLPLCVIDAVFSINANYKSVINTIDRFCKNYHLAKFANPQNIIPTLESQRSVSEIYELIKLVHSNNLANDIFGNRQKTSTKNGILKAEAIKRFLKVLIDFNVLYFQNISDIIRNAEFENCIKKIPGQRSGVSLKYFFMLAGDENGVKPDRMICRFIKSAIDIEVTTEEAVDLINRTAHQIRENGHPNLTPRKLDGIIWRYQKQL